MERSNLIFNLTQTVSRFILPMKFDIRTEGWSNLPEKGPAFLIPKHQQWWDVPLLGHVVPPSPVFPGQTGIVSFLPGPLFYQPTGRDPGGSRISDKKPGHLPGIGPAVEAGSVPGVVS
ncbi:MAG: hypothetical protein EHM75_08845 [Desulfobacteraceae bacterium]|nr:MAG: hypothetical protein EHM75_08845 [Desulfobacteraceae bacterium]